MVSVLVPPTYLKQIELQELAGVWLCAEHLLERADSLTIIGYTFPDADIEAKWLFKRAIAKNQKRLSLTLVEPNPDVRKDVLGFLGDFFEQDVVFFETFESYCEEQMPSEG